MAKKDPMVSSARQADAVAREKERMSRASGDSPAKAKKYADEVRDAAAQRRNGGKP